MDKRSFAWYNEEVPGWYAASGEYVIEIGKSSRDIVLTQALDVKGDPQVIPVIDKDVQIGELLNNDALKEDVLRIFKQEIAQYSHSDGEDLSGLDPMMYAMLQYMPVRSLRSFNQITNERVQEIVDDLKEAVEKIK